MATPVHSCVVLAGFASLAAAGCTETNADFVKATVTRHFTLDRDRTRQLDLDEPVTTVLTQPSQIKELQAFFPSVGHGRQADGAGGWTALAPIEFEDRDGKVTRVTFDPGFEDWSEGRGDWPLSNPDALYEFLAQLQP